MTSFAHTIAATPDFAAPLHANVWTAPKPRKNRALKNRFAHAGAKTANDRKRKSTNTDGMLGTLMLEGLFFAAFPGLGATFNGLNALDLVDAYDTARDAFSNVSPKNTRTAASTPRAHGQFAAEHHARPFTPRRRSLIALMLG